MSTGSLRWEANAFVGFIERQKNLYKRYWLWELVWFVYTLVNVLSIGYLASGLGSLGGVPVGFDVHQAQLFLLVGSLLWGYLSLIFIEVSYAITWERFEGTIEYTFMAPVRRVTHLLSICAFAILYGLIRSALVVAVVVLAFHLDLSSINLLSATVILVVATLPLLGLGIFSAIMPLLSPEKGAQMTHAVEGLLLLVSGVYYPLSVMPLPLRLVGDLSPLTYTLSGMRDAVLHNRPVGALLGTIGLLALMGAILIPLGLWTFSRAEARAKRLGLLKRSG